MTKTHSSLCLILLFVAFSASVTAAAKKGETEEERLHRCCGIKAGLYFLPFDHEGPWFEYIHVIFECATLWFYNNFCHLMLLMIRRGQIIWTWWNLPAQVLRFRHWMWSDEEMLHPGGSRLVFKFYFISSNGQWLDFCFSLRMLCSDILICMFIVQPSVTCNIFVPRLAFGVMKSGPRSAKGVQRLGSRTDPKLLVANFFITI